MRWPERPDPGDPSGVGEGAFTLLRLRGLRRHLAPTPLGTPGLGLLPKGPLGPNVHRAPLRYLGRGGVGVPAVPGGVPCDLPA